MRDGTYLGEVFKSVRLGAKQLRGYYFGTLEAAILKFEAYEKINLNELVR